MVEVSEQELAEAEQELKGLMGEDTGGGYGFPKPPSKESVYKFFKFILSMKDSAKVSNLSIQELGMLNLSLRSCKNLALLSQNFEFPMIQKYFLDQGEIIASTSMGKKGFLAQLFVTQIKKEQKVDSKPPKKSFLFGGKTEEGE